jgi:hypothetical protein
LLFYYYFHIDPGKRNYCRNQATTDYRAMRKFVNTLFFLLILQLSFAQWNPNTAINTPVSAGINEDNGACTIINDGAGGYFIAWHGMHTPFANGGSSDIYMQRLDANGNALWATNGITICNAPDNQNWPKLVSDQAGGAIVIWDDQRNGMFADVIYAQRVNANGSALWSANGVAIGNANTPDANPQILSDGAGGAYITWKKNGGPGFEGDIVAQRINANGNILWAANGITVCNAVLEQRVCRMTSDDNGGFIVTWWDDRSTVTTISAFDIYAQRVSSDGSVQWAVNGVPVCVMPKDQLGAELVSDGSGGAFIAWSDPRNATTANPGYDIYAQHLNSSGAPLWAVNGIPVCTAPDTSKSPSLIRDGNDGVIIAWADQRNSTHSIYAQRITSSGNILWTANGIPVCTIANDYCTPFITTDGNGGAFICWQDRRSGDFDIYGQHVFANGSFEWITNGHVISNAPGYQLMYESQGTVMHGGMVSDNNGSFVVTWQDFRAGFKSHIYATKILFITPTPIILNVNDKCAASPTARGKLANPPYGATITVTQDGLPLSYLPADSSFEYFTTGITTTGSHTVLVKYITASGTRQTDTAYVVFASISSAVSISSPATTICVGTTANFTATVSGAGTSPSYQWTVNGNNVGSNSPVYSSSALQNGDVIKCAIAINPSLQCATVFTAESNNITMIISNAAPPIINITASANNICPGEPVQFTATIANCGTSPSYQWKLNGANVGGNNSTFSSTSLSDNDALSCMVTPGNGSCSSIPVLSNVINMIVKSLPVITVHLSILLSLREAR